MGKKYFTKADYQDRIIGIERYQPGAENTPELSINISSGTSENGISMVLYKIFEMQDTSEHYQVFRYDEIKSFVRLVTKSAQSLRSSLIQLSFKKSRRVLCVDEEDAKHPRLSNILKQFAPEYLMGTSTRVEKTLLSLEKNDAIDSIDAVRYFRLSSEATINRQLELIERLYPKREVVSDYGSAEAENVAFTCPLLNSRYPQEAFKVFHPFKEICLVEIIEKDDLGYGEIAVSTEVSGITNYKTGDVGKLIEEVCACGATQTLFVAGRKNFDIVYCAGATFLTEAIDGVFKNLSEEIADYQVEVRERVSAGNLQGEVLFRIVPQNHINQPEKRLLIKKIADTLQVTKSRTLGQLVEAKIFSTPQVEYVKNIPDSGKKIRLRKVA